MRIAPRQGTFTNTRQEARTTSEISVAFEYLPSQIGVTLINKLPNKKSQLSLIPAKVMGGKPVFDIYLVPLPQI
ncbi:hypothetical protein J6590_062789 [Homalodisca vitripennis]|nr:hypothetical protein J6590_062789 [Homalodisca vitripennis]